MLEFLTDWLQRLLRQPAKLMYIGGSDILPPPLAAQEEQTLLQQAAAGDEAVAFTYGRITSTDAMATTAQELSASTMPVPAVARASCSRSCA